MMNNLKVAVVGAGIYGKHHINAYLHNPDVELVAVCDNNVERCHAAANELGIPGYASLALYLVNIFPEGNKSFCCTRPHNMLIF